MMIKTNLTRPLSNLSQFSNLRDTFFFPIQETFDRFFQDFWGADNVANSIKGKSSGYPKMEIGIEGDKWIVRVAVPGVRDNDLVVEIDESTKTKVLKIQGQMSDEYQSPENGQYFIRELRKSKFIREVILPENLQGEPDASVKDGILTLKWQLKTNPPEETQSYVKKVAIKKD